MASLEDMMAVVQTGPDEYESKTKPERMGNALPIGYGGCTIAVAIRAAFETVDAKYHLYSVMGNYLGPASTDHKLLAFVQRTRDTKTFATRRVQIQQRLSDGKPRTCMDVLLDFHVQEPGLLTYSAQPRMQYSGHEKSLSSAQISESLLKRGELTEKKAESTEKAFGMNWRFFESRYCPEGISGQNLLGVAKQVATTQDHMPSTNKTSAEWQRTWRPLTSPGERAAALGFLLDGAIAFMPLTHNHLYFEDSSAVSSLDFALRVFVPEVDLGGWHLRERNSMSAGHGRSYGEARLWDDKGTLVASMTQQCILRPPTKKAKI